MTSTAAPASASRVERAVGVGGDLELALGERVGGAGERGVAGWEGCIAAGDVGADGPRLGVGLVEEDADGLAARADVHRAVTIER